MGAVDQYLAKLPADRRDAIALALACVLTACYSPGYRDCEVTCSTGACPSGLSCEQGYCRAPGATVSCSVVLDDGGTDATGDAAVPFGTPVAITNDATALDHDPCFTDDLLELYTSRDPASGAGADIYRYARNTPAAAFGTATLDQGISTAAVAEEGPDIFNSRTIYFIRDGTSLRDINVGIRGQPGGAWSSTMPIPELDPGGNSANPASSRDGLMMVFERLDEVQYSLWQSTRASITANWTPSQPITSLPINAGFKPHSPALSADKRTIYFHALGPSGTNDIFEAHRPDVTSPFGAPVQVAGINTAGEQEEDPWISEDGKMIVFVRTQGNGTLIMMAQRP